MKLSTSLALTVLMLLASCGGGGGGGTTSATGSTASNGSSTPPVNGQPGATPVTPVAVPGGGPALFFTDLTSGPATGNSDNSQGVDPAAGVQTANADGAIVTLWGKNLGGSRADSTITVGGVPARVYYWGNAARGGGADLYTRPGMQMIEFQIPHGAPSGAVSIAVTVNVNGTPSTATLPFTIRSGNIYFVKSTGADNPAGGSWASPWRTVAYAKDRITAGDIVYVGDGVSATAEIGLTQDGTSAAPIALVAYPGATVTLGGTGGTGDAISAKQTDPAHRARYWTIAKLRFPGAPTGYANLGIGDGFRVVGNYLTNPIGEGLTGTIQMGGDAYQYDGNVAVLGNELADISAGAGFDAEKMYHTIYLSGKRQGGTTHAPTMSNIEVAWNYIHDNRNNRAINIYSEQDGCSLIEQVRIHDNLIVNQRGDGILVGKAITGTANTVYNNVIVNSGLGPNWRNNEGSSNSAIRISAGWPGLAASATKVSVYNNSIQGGGYASNTDSVAIYYSPSEVGSSWVMTLDFVNNIVMGSDVPYWNGDPASVAAAPNLWYGRNSGIPSWNSGGLQGNPLFADSNLRLASGSPARDAGSASVSSVVAKDFDGVTRPQGGGNLFDLGAFEYK